MVDLYQNTHRKVVNHFQFFMGGDCCNIYIGIDRFILFKRKLSSQLGYYHSLKLWLEVIEMTSKDILSEFPFTSKFIEINGSNIHYIEEGAGDPIVFIHYLQEDNPHLIGSELAQWYKDFG